MRIGIGYDIHRLVTGRKLILGGVEIPYELGLEGHSDADVVCHALCDALLGACGQGDLGKHFPDTDSAYKNISGLVLLQRVMEILGANRFEVSNVDSTVIAEKPRLNRFIREMRSKIAEVLKVEPAQVNIKAGTNEGLDSLGHGDGIACHAVALIRPIAAESKPSE
jgi:2-C-methyl-D-erythritol 2,4-cyclodiphosphate synthase